MTDLNYSISFNKADLARDIAEGLENLLKDKSIQDRYKIADNILNVLFELGNYALYRGMVDYGIKLAVNKLPVTDKSTRVHVVNKDISEEA